MCEMCDMSQVMNWMSYFAVEDLAWLGMAGMQKDFRQRICGLKTWNKYTSSHAIYHLQVCARGTMLVYHKYHAGAGQSGIAYSIVKYRQRQSACEEAVFCHFLSFCHFFFCCCHCHAGACDLHLEPFTRPPPARLAPALRGGGVCNGRTEETDSL